MAEGDSVDVYHNIMWSRYKAKVFSALYAQSKKIRVNIVQIAETERDRVVLGSVATDYHDYPYKLLFRGAYSDISKPHLIVTLVRDVWKSDAALTILPGYDRIEYWIMLATTCARGRKRAVFCDSTYFDRRQTLVKSILKRVFFATCNGFFAYGQRSREYLQLHGVPDDRIFHRCQAAALSNDYNPDTAFNRRVGLTTAGGSIQLLYVGRLAQEKNVSLILRAMAKINEMHATHLLTLKIVGDGPLRELLEAEVRTLGINAQVTFLGAKTPEELAKIYAEVFCLVLPSFSEPWGLVVNEALSYGCPVLVSVRCGCVPELVNESTGIVFDPFEPSGLVEALLIARERFGDRAKTARECISLISTYTPGRAASEIIKGVNSILSRD